LGKARRERALTEKELAEEWQTVDGAKQGPEEKLRRAMRDAFLAQADRVEQRLAEGSFVTGGRADEVLTADAIFDLSQALAETLNVSQEALEEALRVGYETGALRVDDRAAFDPEAPWVQRALARLNDQMRRVPQNTRRVINEVITAGENDPSKSVHDIAGDITSRLRQMASGTGGPGQSGSADRSRARRIAATSTTTAFETAQDQAWSESDVVGSSWLSQRDSRVSEGHFEADGQRRQLGQPFLVRRTFEAAKEQMLHPGDPEARASNVVNCRCTRRPLFEMDAD
jgi:hypothetical protein